MKWQVRILQHYSKKRKKINDETITPFQKAAVPAKLVRDILGSMTIYDGDYT